MTIVTGTKLKNSKVSSGDAEAGGKIKGTAVADYNDGLTVSPQEG